jgi:arylsulfatase A-like enzyme
MIKRILMALILGAAVSVHAAAAGKPNIVFILSDDHSIQTIGAYGARLSDFCRQQNVTPNMDRLAAAGAVFPNSFCCNSLCSPSRAAILTGLHSHANGVMTLGKPITEGLWTYPRALREAGYQTAVVGKWHLGDTPANTDYWRLFPGQGKYWNPTLIGPNGAEERTGYATDILTELGLDWLKQRDKSKPFMLMVHHKAPHRPWEPPTRYYRWLADATIPEPPTLFDDYAGRGTPAHAQKMEIARDMTLAGDLKVHPAGKGRPDAEWQAAYGPRNEAFYRANLQGAALTRWKYQEHMKDYLRCVKAVDDSVGAFLDYLKAEGLEENTVVIYASDQGFFNGEHGWFDKRWIYEESIHMPLIVRWPGVVKPGSRPTPLVQNIDYAETFVEMAGGRVPDGLHGRSLVPILRNVFAHRQAGKSGIKDLPDCRPMGKNTGETPADWRKSIYYHYYDPGHGVAKHYGVRTDRYTLVCFYETNEWELFDNEKDPRQLRSVYADPAYAKTVEELKAELARLRALYKDNGEDATPRAKIKTE